ncbi:MAG: response regulator [Candidatus Magnetomorum sp.]|nr:response regulator [Candidatus Magnetomorum sp.]
MKILTVDDDSLIRKIIRRELEPAGYQLFDAVHGKEGLEKLFTIPDIDLITLDVEMPVMGGFDVLSNLNTPESIAQLKLVNNTNVPVILVTSNDTKKVRDKGFKLGAANFVVKPFSRGELLHAVNKILKPKDLLKDLSVLVVDDSITLRKFIVSSIMELGVTIYEADDGTTAFDLVKELRNDIDLVLSDLHMKRMNGDDLCRKIRNELGIKDMPIIFLSSNEDRNKILELFKIGATDYLSKPFFKEELLARMYVHLEHRKMNKNRIKIVSELKAMKRFKVAIASLFSQDLRPPVQTIIDSAKHVLKSKDHGDDFNKTINNITSLSQALLYKINDIYSILDQYAKTSAAQSISTDIHNTKTILIAEAKKVDTILLSNLLKDYPCTIKTSDNAALTIMAVQQSFEKKPFDVIFIDMDSMLINGLTTMMKIQQLIQNDQPKPKPVIIAMTENNSTAILDSSCASSIHEVIPKPIKRLQLKTIMGKYL